MEENASRLKTYYKNLRQRDAEPRDETFQTEHEITGTIPTTTHLCIHIDVNNSNAVYVTLASSNGNSVYYTNNGGTSWTKLNEQKAKGTASSYQTIDPKPVYGINYYRWFKPAKFIQWCVFFRDTKPTDERAEGAFFFAPTCKKTFLLGNAHRAYVLN